MSTFVLPALRIQFLKHFNSMNLGVSLDHIILPKDVTDGFYSTWHNYYGELFPSPVKPKYRPLSKIFAPESDAITQSTPNLLEHQQATFMIAGGDADDDDSTTSGSIVPEASAIHPITELSLSHGVRVGDNIDEFIRNNRRSMLMERSNSLNEIIVNEFDEADIFAKFMGEGESNCGEGVITKRDDSYERHNQQSTKKTEDVKLRPKSDIIRASSSSSRNRFSWCSSNNAIKFLSNLQSKKKMTYDCVATAEEHAVINETSQKIVFDGK